MQPSRVHTPIRGQQHVTATEPTPSSPDAGDTAGKALDAVFRLYRETHPSYTNVYAGNMEGAFVLNSPVSGKTQPSGYDPRKRPWWGMKDKGFDSQIVSALANVAAADLQQAIATADAASKKSAHAAGADAPLEG